MSKEAFGRLSKELFVRGIAQDAEGVDALFVTRFAHISSSAMDALRRKLKAAHAHYRVVKNSLARRALAGSPFEELERSLDGQCGFVMTREDATRVSKVLAEFAEEYAAFEIESAYVAGQVFGREAVKALAKLPAREELLAKVAAGLQSPVRGFVGALSGVLRNLVGVMNEIRKSKESK